MFIGRSGLGTDQLVAQAGDFFVDGLFQFFFRLKIFLFCLPLQIFSNFVYVLLCVLFHPLLFFTLLCGLGVYSDSDWLCLLSCDV